jgi:hypothetical protein
MKTIAMSGLRAGDRPGSAPQLRFHDELRKGNAALSNRDIDRILYGSRTAPEMQIPRHGITFQP